MRIRGEKFCLGFLGEELTLFQKLTHSWPAVAVTNVFHVWNWNFPKATPAVLALASGTVSDDLEVFLSPPPNSPFSVGHSMPDLLTLEKSTRDLLRYRMSKCRLLWEVATFSLTMEGRQERGGNTSPSGVVEVV